MGVNFSPIEIGRRALQASQLGLTVAGQNIANVNTPGYSRQSVQLSASPSSGSGLVGSGVTIEGVRQFRDRFIDARLQTETGIAGRWTAQRDALSPVDPVFNEADGQGLNASLSGFFNSFTALETSPSSIPLRNDVVAKAGLMTTAFGSAQSRLIAIRGDADQNLRATVSQVNVLSNQIRDLNVHIGNAEASGDSASELRDQRGELVRQMAELTGAHSVEDASGMVTLTLSDGQALVSGNHANQLEVVDTPPNGLANITMNGQAVAITDGRIRGLQDAISAVGSQVDSLDSLAAAIAARVNTLHRSGTDLNGNAGGNFFNVPAAGPITAANLSVSAAIKNDPKLIVASPLAVPTTSATVAGSIGALLTDPNSTAGLRTGSFGSIYASIVADAGQGVKTAEDALVTQQAIVAQVTAQRDSVSGVSLDEEAVNLLQFQRAYEAAAKFLKIADEMTQTILTLGT